MAVPVITPLPAAPNRGDAPADFSSKADTFVAALPPMVAQINISLTWTAAQVQAVQGYASAAFDSAAAAAQSASGTGADAAAAHASALSAASSAAAAGSAAGLPSLTGNAGKFLGVNPGATGVAWLDAGQKIGDVLTTARIPDASYLNMNGAVYLQSAYPELFALVGLIGGDVGTNWSSVATGFTSVTKIARSSTGTLIGITTTTNTIVRSTNNGASWSSINAGVGTLAADVDTDGNGKWMIALTSSSGGSYQRISTDDGLTWAAGAATGPTSLICRYIGNSIWVGGGSNSLLWRSTNNGVSFSGVTGTTISSGSTIATNRNGTAVIASPSTGNYRSIDGFATLSAAPTGISISPTSISTDGSGTWVAIGAAGAMYRSIDNGVTFSAISSGTTTSLSSISNDGAGVWLIGGAAGLLRRSKDNLNTFEAISGLSGNINTIVLTKTFAVAGNDAGAIYKSSPFYSYDTATQFRVPQGTPPMGLSSYIKARAAA